MLPLIKAYQSVYLISLYMYKIPRYCVATSVVMLSFKLKRMRKYISTLVGDDFGEHSRKIALIVKALYGLITSAEKFLYFALL